MHTTHLEVTRGDSTGYTKPGQLLAVIHETKCFYFVRTFGGAEIKVSKKTNEGCGWRTQSNAPAFNL